MNTTTKIILVIIFILACLGGYWFVRSGQLPATSQEARIGDIAAIQATLDSYATSSNAVPVETANTAPVAATQPAPASAPAASEKKISSATLHTSMGDMEIVFNPATPNTVANFLKLASSGFYDGTKFHRVIKGFMSQGGDPFSRDDTKSDMWGTGGPGYTFADELSAANSNDPYTIAMANSGPNTNGSQFFINAAPNHFLDGKHVVFARVVKGQDIAAAINAVATGPNDRPVQSVVITSISFQ